MLFFYARISGFGDRDDWGNFSALSLVISAIAKIYPYMFLSPEPEIVNLS